MNTLVKRGPKKKASLRVYYGALTDQMLQSDIATLCQSYRFRVAQQNELEKVLPKARAIPGVPLRRMVWDGEQRLMAIQNEIKDIELHLRIANQEKSRRGLV